MTSPSYMYAWLIDVVKEGVERQRLGGVCRSLDSLRHAAKKGSPLGQSSRTHKRISDQSCVDSTASEWGREGVADTSSTEGECQHSLKVFCVCIRFPLVYYSVIPALETTIVKIIATGANPPAFLLVLKSL